MSSQPHSVSGQVPPASQGGPVLLRAGTPDAKTAAHQYLDLGFDPVGWIILKGEKAAVSMKGRHYRDYQVSHAEIEKWPSSWQVGLAMSQRSGFWALDFDCTWDRVHEFFEEWHPDRTAIQKTGRGYHFVYKGTGGNEWPRDGIWSTDWIDVQVAANRFIAAAPSIHPNGAVYRWTDWPVAEPGTLFLGSRPERVSRHAGSGGRGRDGGPDGDLKYFAANGIELGWQDDTLHRLACRHVRSMGEQELFDWLWKAVLASAQNWNNPWRPENVLSKIRNAAEFVSQSDKAAMKMHDAWMAAMGGDR